MREAVFYAHTFPGDSTGARWQPLKDHAAQVAQRARQHAEPFGEGDRAALAGLLHDLGKYGTLFQRRLWGEGRGLDHWSAGACLAKQAYHDAGLALAIAGHHTGLPSGDGDSLRALSLDHLRAQHPLGLRLTEPEPDQTNLKTLVQRLRADGLTLPPPLPRPLTPGTTAAQMLDTRMLFSALVDADHLDTEAAMRPDDEPPRPTGLPLDAARLLAALERRLAELAHEEGLPPATRALRADLMEACRAAGESADRLWTLTAPTGSGKTLAMLLFALTRAVRQPLARPIRRIVVVLPFLSILDQTADEYRRLVAAAGLSPQCLLEHHSLAGTQGAEDAAGCAARQLVENWDAPIILTTSVQLLESLHAHTPGACRKLHRLAQSVILLDEVQTLPAPLVTLTLKTLARLTHEKYGTTVVMATATQPAFDRLSEQVREPGNGGWQPREMAPPTLQLFERARRVTPRWHLETSTPWREVQDWLRREPQSLCIVNLRQDALELAQALSDVPGLRHLSTFLCPAHRRAVLEEVRADLQAGRPVRLVSTQCVEAGVDLDVPVVFRALAPLDALAQAAGRCNRHGRRPHGTLHVFLPQDARYPTPAYQRAALLTLSLVREAGGELDLDDPATFRRFYERLWPYTSPDREELRAAVLRQDYPAVAQLYRLIPPSSVNVVVPYGEGAALIEEARQQGITRTWMRRAQPYTVTVFRRADGTLPPHCEPVHLRGRRGAPPEPAATWFVCPYPAAYDPQLLGWQPDGGGAEPFVQ
ncbi:CRISPR-associated endonuclease Cas3'' [Deinococcus sp. YIM 77859]|uniref:CRISPR-associated endonuclease Cas3'' n=1 Tax=Deinococcus sp. YIM 77859 TaxID=1540221 RepID=UPI00068F9B4E|nr:CRISPR-associated endonuclease Cas3'' [Deinococcus sp. YIM 77859]